MQHVIDAFHHELGIREDRLIVSPHHPEDFFALFDDVQEREDAIDYESFESHDRIFNILPWSAERHTNWTPLPYHVRLYIEGLPNQA